MIKRFHAIYVGMIELDNIGIDGTPANERRYPNERLGEVFFTARRIARHLAAGDVGDRLERIIGLHIDEVRRAKSRRQLQSSRVRRRAEARDEQHPTIPPARFGNVR